MNSVQQLKALGCLTNVDLADVGNLYVDTSIYNTMLANRQCGCPDQADEEIADCNDPERLRGILGIGDDDNTTDDEDIEQARCISECHRRMAARGAGSWPICHPSTHPQHHAVTYAVDVDSFPNHYKRGVTPDEIKGLIANKVFRWSEEEALDLFTGKNVLDFCLVLGVEEAFRLAGCAHVRIESWQDAHVRIKSRRIPGSTIGLGWFNSAACNDQTEFHIDSSWDPSYIERRIRLFCHECGHCSNLEHTFSGQSRHHGIMSYDDGDGSFYGFSTGEAPHILPRDPAWRQLSRFFSPAPIPLPDEPPQPPPDVGPPWWSGGLSESDFAVVRSVAQSLSRDGAEPAHLYREISV